METKKKPNKASFWEPTCLQKSTPEASGSALDASCARLPRQELSKSAFGGLQGRKKVPRAPLGEMLANKGQKDFFEAGSFLPWSAVLARPVKAYPGGLGQARLGSKVSNTLITASGGRRIDYGSANTADHLLLARRFVASGCLQKKACFACLLAWLAWLAWLACFVAAWLLRSAL